MHISRFCGRATLALLGGLISSHALARNNIATGLVDNQTAVAAAFTYEHMAGTSSPAMGNVEPESVERFVVTSFADSLSGLRFVYSAGNRKCRFSVSHTASPPRYIPTWKKDAVSIGSSTARCTVKLEGIDARLPYDYTVRFTIQ